jgi:hypothetical protein
MNIMDNMSEVERNRYRVVVLSFIENFIEMRMLAERKETFTLLEIFDTIKKLWSIADIVGLRKILTKSLIIKISSDDEITLDKKGDKIIKDLSEIFS